MNLLAAICCIRGGLHNEHRPIVAQVLCIMPSPPWSFLQSWVSHINLFDYPHVTTLLNVHPTTDCWCVRVALFYCTFFNTFLFWKNLFILHLKEGAFFSSLYFKFCRLCIFFHWRGLLSAFGARAAISSPTAYDFFWCVPFTWQQIGHSSVYEMDIKVMMREIVLESHRRNCSSKKPNVSQLAAIKRRRLQGCVQFPKIDPFTQAGGMFVNEA